MISLLLGLLSASAQDVDYELNDVTSVLPNPEERWCITVGGLYAPTRALLRGYTVSCDVPGVDAFLGRTNLVGDEYKRRIRVCYPWDLEPVPVQTICEIHTSDGSFFALWIMNFVYEF